MAKTVMIPSSETETWICRINHKEYSYPAGTTQTVPDEVAELIEAIYASDEEPAPVDKSKWAVYSQGGWNEVPSGLPDASEASNGDVLTIEAGEPAWKAPSGGGGGGTADSGRVELSDEIVQIEFGDNTYNAKMANKSYNDLYNATVTPFIYYNPDEGGGDDPVLHSVGDQKAAVKSGTKAAGDSDGGGYVVYQLAQLMWQSYDDGGDEGGDEGGGTRSAKNTRSVATAYVAVFASETMGGSPLRLASMSEDDYMYCLIDVVDDGGDDNEVN